jgi:hypothetical protein
MDLQTIKITFLKSIFKLHHTTRPHGVSSDVTIIGKLVIISLRGFTYDIIIKLFITTYSALVSSGLKVFAKGCISHKHRISFAYSFFN